MNPSNTPPVLLGKLTRREFRNRMQSGELKACILPLAAVEQHLEHMAMEHDWRSVNVMANLTAERLSPRVLVAEGLMAGISEHHMTHPGTLTLKPGTFLAVVSDLIESLVRAGFRNILVLNGHGGNVIPCQQTWDQFLRYFQINLHFMSYWDVLTQQDAVELLTSGHRLPDDLPGHAQEFETSVALKWFPENVRQDALSDQADPTPATATLEKGEAFTQRIVDRLVDYLRDMIEGKRVQPVPPFHP
ncbi:MAG: creatininase family protein [Verrucomicrobia bacterium]|jgi:creatinine amidohydrolase|nr:creatininase family protein [Verrucomicrobiota bacterium]